MFKKNDPVPVETFIDKLKSSPALTNKDKEFEVLRRWPQIAGERIAASTRPMYIAEHNLYILAKGSVWCQEIAYIKRKVIREINDAMGFDAIKDIRFRVEGMDD